jgi:molybdopterin molybdotransferase
MTEPDVSQLLSVAEAIAVIDAVEVTPRIVSVPLGEARGLYLAQDLAADRDYPPFDKSLMDGYAVRAADVASAPATLRWARSPPGRKRRDRSPLARRWRS